MNNAQSLGRGSQPGKRPKIRRRLPSAAFADEARTKVASSAGVKSLKLFHPARVP